MKRTLLALSVIFISTGLKAQDSQLAKADSLMNLGQFKQAILEYDRVYKSDSSNMNYLYSYASALALDKQADKAFYYLNKASVFDSTVATVNNPDFYFLIEDPRWKDLQNKLIANVESKYGPYVKRELARELWTMKIKDQAFYFHLQIAEKQGGMDSPMINVVWELKEKLNQQNLLRLKEILDKEGWPKSSEVRGYAAQTVFLIIQHSDLETQQKYLPLMKEAAEKGEADKGSLALLIDRVNLGEGKQQIYGSQIFRHDDGSFYVKDLFEPEYVNQRRKEVGLGPIEEYVGMWEIKWEIEQKEK